MSTFPLGGTVVSQALYKSRPAVLDDPLLGVRAFSVIFTKRSIALLREDVIFPELNVVGLLKM